MNSTLLQQTLGDNNYNNDEIILTHYNKARELPHFSQMINSKKTLNMPSGILFIISVSKFGFKMAVTK